jgi:hypothetical protein
MSFGVPSESKERQFMEKKKTYGRGPAFQKPAAMAL